MRSADESFPQLWRFLILAGVVGVVALQIIRLFLDGTALGTVQLFGVGALLLFVFVVLALVRKGQTSSTEAAAGVQETNANRADDTPPHMSNSAETTTDTAWETADE